MDDTTMILAATYLGSKLLDGSLEALGGELSKGALNWVKSRFFKEDNSPNEVLADLQSNPDDADNRDAVRILLSKAVKKDPDAEQWLQEIYALAQKQMVPSNNTIVNSKNVVTGNINAGRSVNIGDRNYQH